MRCPFGSRSSHTSPVLRWATVRREVVVSSAFGLAIRLTLPDGRQTWTLQPGVIAGFGVYATAAAGVFAFVGGIIALNHPAVAMGRTAEAPLPPTMPAPGWFNDPCGADVLRWWDGTAWSEHTTRPEF